jgi:hypothetical protein
MPVDAHTPSLGAFSFPANALLGIVPQQATIFTDTHIKMRIYDVCFCGPVYSAPDWPTKDSSHHMYWSVPLTPLELTGDLESPYPAAETLEILAFEARFLDMWEARKTSALGSGGI